MVTAAMKLKDTPWKESYVQPRSASVTTICENPGGTDVRSGLLTSMELEVQKLVWVLKGKVNFVICVSLKTKLSGMLEVF